ncbi:MAG TPA: tetratricopeptide repeat protein [Polyangiales bacterium]
MLAIVAALVAKCSACVFENPRGWVSCARCGQLLGPAPDRSGTGDTDPTRRAPFPSEGPPPSAADDDRTKLFRSPEWSTDARPLIGQETSIEAMRRGIQHAFGHRKPTLIGIEGARGAGRTRLLQRASELAARNYVDVRVLYAACRGRDEGAYAPFSRLLIERFGITPTSSPMSVRGQMATTVGEVLGSTDPTDVAETTHLLGHIAGVPFPDSPYLGNLENDPIELHQRASVALRRLLEGDARNRPVLILLDDLDQAEPDAWQLLETLLAANAPLSFIVSGQEALAERVTRYGRGVTSEVARIRPLTDAEVSELAIALIPGLRDTPEPFVSALKHRSRGNAGALKELLQALQERGLFRTTANGIAVDVEKLERGDLPLTMADAIRARLSALEPFELLVMQQASVVGEMFWDGALLAIQRSERERPQLAADPIRLWTEDRDEIRLNEALTHLEAKRFIVRIAEADVPGLHEYTFHFAGARAVIYSDLPEALRVNRHAIVARWMTMASGIPSDGLAAILAPHLERAGQKERAAEAYLAAGSDERRRMRTTMALRYVEKALPLVGADEVATRIEALHEHGSLLTTLGRYDEATESFKEIVDLAWRLGARGTGGAALNRIARIHRQRGEHIRALDYLKCALLLFRAADDQRGVASTYDDLAQVYRMLGNLEPSLVAAKEALDIRTAIKDKRGQAVSLNTIGFIELDRGNFEAAQARFSAALTIREAIGDHEGAVQTRIGLGKLAYHQGRLGDALRFYKAGLDGAREMDNQRFQSYLLNHLGEAYLADGKTEDAQAMLLDARRLALGMRDQRVLAEIQRNLGLVALQRGDPGAKEQLDAALDLAREYGTREAIALAHRGIARWHARTLFDQGGQAGGQVGGDAETTFRESVRIFQECGNLHEVARTQAELGYHLIERGLAARAREALTQAYLTMKRLGLPELAKVTDTLAQV